jgi:predicted Zn finger-like uncharacterized protein
MSLITCCPACATMFKVVPDQLKISEGWVRCGHCGEIFDAASSLQADESWITAPSDLQPEPPAPAATARAARESQSQEFASSLHTEIGEESLSSEAPDSALLEATAQSLVEHPLDRPFELRREDDGAIAEIQGELPAHLRAAVVHQPEPEPALEDLTFVQQADRKAFWRRPAMRAALAVAALFLVVLMALQFALFDRDRLFATTPALRPALAKLCEQLRCTIKAPRQIDAVAIDSSRFNKLRPDAYRLEVTLKNQAQSDVAMPALELTLTDGQDQPLVRRILQPEELTPPAAAIPAAAEWSGSVALVVAANGPGNRVVGYRLLAFYP